MGLEFGVWGSQALHLNACRERLDLKVLGFQVVLPVCTWGQRYSGNNRWRRVVPTAACHKDKRSRIQNEFDMMLLQSYWCSRGNGGVKVGTM